MCVAVESIECNENIYTDCAIAVFIWLGAGWLSRRSVLPGRDYGGQDVSVASFVRALEGLR